MVFEAKGKRICMRSKGKVRRFTAEPIPFLKKLLKKCAVKRGSSKLPFESGAIGYFSYEAGKYFDSSLSFQKPSGLDVPDIYLMFFNQGIVWDHASHEVIICANSKTGFEQLSKVCFLERVCSAKRPRILRSSVAAEKKSWTSMASDDRPRRGRSSVAEKSTFGQRDFANAVKKIKQHIKNGDVYQVNLAQRLEFELKQDPLSVYERLRQVNPSPFFGYLDAGKFQMICGSPERLVCVKGRMVETRPIAGTRPRGETHKKDQKMAGELLLNEKERAEHIMLVDLERNDLGKVCEYGSVKADELMVLEDYSHVKHIVSNVKGVLKKNCDALDVLGALFPGGTITGTPKIICTKIIKALEPVSRGPYTGSMGYFGFTGDMDWNIIIRSLIVQKKKAYLYAGAGIVADSNPQKEYAETLHKAEAVLSAVFGKERAREFVRKKISTP